MYSLKIFFSLFANTEKAEKPFSRILYLARQRTTAPIYLFTPLHAFVFASVLIFLFLSLYCFILLFLSHLQ